MTQKEIGKKLGITRESAKYYLGKYGKKAKECTEEDVKNLKDIVNGTKKIEEIKIQKQSKLKEVLKDNDKTFVLDQLRTTYNFNIKIIEDCEKQIVMYGTFQEDKWGNCKTSPAVTLKHKTEKEQRDLIKLMNELEEMTSKEVEELDSDYGGLM